MIPLPDWRKLLLIFFSGALLPLAFAPVNVSPLAFLAPIPLFAAWLKGTPRASMQAGIVFGLGLFGVGVSWVYVAIHEFGHSNIVVASLLTLIFVVVLALYFGLVGYLVRKLVSAHQPSDALLLLIVIPALWTLGEWFRGWFLTGFPWLSLGYSQIDSPLRGFAPVLGVYGVSWLCALTAGALLLVWRKRLRALPVVVPLLLLIWGGGAYLSTLNWTQPVGKPLRVTLIQGNVPQETKWDPEAIRARLERYAGLTQQHFDDSELIIWPENAVTVFYSDIKEAFFDGLAEEARSTHTDLILGVPLLDDDGVHYYTTMMSLGSHHAFYRKRHLVPFGEFLPLEGLLRGLINFFSLPMSSFSPGPQGQPPLEVAGQKVAATVCYEDAFGSEMLDFLPEATLLVNGSNNAWYGDSLAPHQHLQISRMRALETGRAMLRATTNGISALIDSNGALIATTPQFQTATISNVIQARGGFTPYIRIGNAICLLLGLIVVGVGLSGRLRAREDLVRTF